MSKFRMFKFNLPTYSCSRNILTIVTINIYYRHWINVCALSVKNLLPDIVKTLTFKPVLYSKDKKKTF